MAGGHLQAASRRSYSNGTSAVSPSSISGRDEPTVRTILVSSTLFATVLFSVLLGVISAYAVIHGILYAFAHRTTPREEPAAVLMAQEATLQQ
jgi:hypothetical protein